MADLVAEYASTADVAWLGARDDHLDQSLVEAKVGRREYIVVRRSGELIGFLRMSFFWSTIPYIDLIRVESSARRQGAGRAMLRLLERRAAENGEAIVMSSSQADEPGPQAWHRHVGFRDAGAIVGFSPVQDVPEIVFIKAAE